MNMLRRSVGRAVRSRIVPYVALYAVLLALHLQFTLGTGDDPMYAAMLDQYSLAYFSLWHYYTWSARTLIEAVVCIVEALPAIVWRLADPLCITLCAACIVRLARLEDRPAGRWAVCGLALEYGAAENAAVPALLPIVALGLSMLLYALSMMEAYELLVYNEEYTGKLSTRLLKRLRGIGRRHLP